MRKMRIDIVSDVVCPWCAVGYKQLEKALAELGDKIEPEIHWHPFELNPDMAESGENLRQHIANKYGTSPEDSVRARENITHIGRELGFTFDYFDDMKMYNTFNAHQLICYARDQGMETEMKLRLMEAFFGERKALNDDAVLVAEAEAIGLDATEVKEILAGQVYAKEVRGEQKFWQGLGVSAVPTMVFDEKYASQGAQDAALIARQIESIL